MALLCSWNTLCWVQRAWDTLVACIYKATCCSQGLKTSFKKKDFSSLSLNTHNALLPYLHPPKSEIRRFSHPLFLSYSLPFLTLQGGWEHITVRGNATERTKMAAQDGPSSSPHDLSSLEVHGSYQLQSTIFVDGVQGLDRNAVQC